MIELDAKCTGEELRLSQTKKKTCEWHLRRVCTADLEYLHSIEASRRMVQKYDFVITSGGIGPTHDGACLYSYLDQSIGSHQTDITYQSLAKAFNQPLTHHQETLRRMTEMSKHRPWISQQTEEQKTARERMALFPNDAEVLYIASDIWVVSILTCSC